jgi:hypothetical protein
MLDFYADWCVSCKEMEKYTFTDPPCRQRARQHALLLQADVTANDADDQALLKHFGIFGSADDRVLRQGRRGAQQLPRGGLHEGGRVFEVVARGHCRYKVADEQKHHRRDRSVGGRRGGHRRLPRVSSRSRRQRPGLKPAVDRINR